MPFTPTHLAAIVPIAKLAGDRLPLAALAVGSLIPDLPLFFRLPFRVGYATTHSLAGLLTTCLPFGLVAFLLLEFVLKQPMIELLPGPIRSRLAPLAKSRVEFTVASLARAALAIVIGASTHLVWDAFTHHDRWGTRLFPGLELTALKLAGHAVPGYKVLQYGSSIVFLPVLAWLLIRRIRQCQPEGLPAETAQEQRKRFLVWFGALAIPIGVTACVAAREPGSAYGKFGLAITTTGFWLAIAAVAYAVADRFASLALPCWRALASVLTLMAVSSYFAYSTAGFDFEWPAPQGVDVLYLRLRWDDGSTWLGYAVQPRARPDRALDWFDPGGTILDRPTRPAHVSWWNDLGFWRVDDPSADPYAFPRYAGATASRWWACPSWLVVVGLWFFDLRRRFRGSRRRNRPS